MLLTNGRILFCSFMFHYLHHWLCTAEKGNIKTFTLLIKSYKRRKSLEVKRISMRKDVKKRSPLRQKGLR